MKPINLTATRKLVLASFLFLMLHSSCTKNNPDHLTTPASEGGAEYVGTILVNASWNTPASTSNCPNPALVTVELKGPNGFTYSKTLNTTPVRLEERLANGLYTFMITKSKGSCADFAPVTKTGSFYISGCPTGCENPTVVNLNLD